MSMTETRRKKGARKAKHIPANNRASVRQERREWRAAAKAAVSEKRGQAARQAIAAKRAACSVEITEGVRQALLAALIAAGGDAGAVSVIDLALQLKPGGELVWSGTAAEWAKARNAAVLAKRVERRAFKVEEAVVYRGRRLPPIEVLVITRTGGA